MNLSIIMPVYNAVNTVARSINSFKRLSKLTDIDCKLYIIEDFSSDGTLNKVVELSKQDSNIIVINNARNIGPGLSRNIALKEIKNGYIGFLDADDEILPDGYIGALNTGIKMDSDWITFNGWFCNKIKKSEKYDFNRLIDDTKKLSIRCIRGELDGSVIFTIYSRELINLNNLSFSNGYYEDIPFAYSAMLLAKKRYISTKFGYKKHNISSSIVNTVSEKHINGLIDACVRISNNMSTYNLLNYKESEFDRIYGIHGYIASLIRSIILSNISDKYRTDLFKVLHLKINSSIDLKGLNYKIVTNKDKLVQYFCRNYLRNQNTFLEDITSYYHTLFNEKI